MFKNSCLIALIAYEDFCNKVLVTTVIEGGVGPLDYCSLNHYYYLATAIPQMALLS